MRGPEKREAKTSAPVGLRTPSSAPSMVIVGTVGVSPVGMAVIALCCVHMVMAVIVAVVVAVIVAVRMVVVEMLVDHITGGVNMDMCFVGSDKAAESKEHSQLHNKHRMKVWKQPPNRNVKMDELLQRVEALALSLTIMCSMCGEERFEKREEKSCQQRKAFTQSYALHLDGWV